MAAFWLQWCSSLILQKAQDLTKVLLSFHRYTCPFSPICMVQKKKAGKLRQNQTIIPQTSRFNFVKVPDGLSVLLPFCVKTVV